MKSIVLYMHITESETSQLLPQHGAEPTLRLTGKTLHRKLLRERFVQESWLGPHVWGCAGDVGCARRVPSPPQPPSPALCRGEQQWNVQRFTHCRGELETNAALLRASEGGNEASLPMLAHSSSSGLTDFSVPVVLCIHNTPALQCAVHLQQLHGLCTLGLEGGVLWSHCLSFVSKLKQEGNSCWKGVSWAHTQEGGFICLFIYFKNPLKYFSEHPRSKGQWSHWDTPRGRPLL